MTPRYAIVRRDGKATYPGGPFVSGVLEAAEDEQWPDRHRRLHWLLARVAFRGSTPWFPWTGGLICQDDALEGEPAVMALGLPDGSMVDARLILPPSQRVSIAQHALELLELANSPGTPGKPGYLNGEARP